MTRTHTMPLAVTPIGVWDRIAIVALGAAGCALSYDALQQMAVAIHVRGLLTYLFPLVIDGFIAYGVRALLVLSAAPLRARLYVWALFGIATAASIWANALHAVRLNQQTTHDGLRLGDTVVAVLSTLAPLALAGAVHLYILITRHHPQPVPDRDRDDTVPPRTLAADEAGPAGRTGAVPNRDRDALPVPATAAVPYLGSGKDGDRGPGAIFVGDWDRDVTVPETDHHGDRPHTVPQTDGPRTHPAHHTGDRDHNPTVPETDHHGDRPHTVPETDRGKASSAKRTRHESQERQGGRSRSSRPLTDDEITERLRPHVPAVLKRDQNEEITRVQLREIMRAQGIGIRNSRLSPVLHRLRHEMAPVPTTKRSAR